MTPNIQIKPLHQINISTNKMAQIVLNQDFKHGAKTPGFPLATYRDFVYHNTNLNRIVLYKMRRQAASLMTAEETEKFNNKRFDEDSQTWVKTSRIVQFKPPLEACGVSMGILKGNSGVDANNINPTVDIVQSTDDKVHYHKLASCAMIWRCPVCSLKIMKGRESTIYALAKSHERANKVMGFTTLTLPHAQNDTLKTTLDKLIDSFKHLQKQRFYREFRSGCKRKGHETPGKILGQIKSVEITWKYRNGWHPHLHILTFYDFDLQDNQKVITDFQERTLAWWCKMTGAKRIGQDQQLCYGIKGAAEYMAKWDAVKELTAEQLKQGKGITPFGILKKLALHDYANTRQKTRLSKLYREYAEVTKGKHRISFGKNLKNAYPKVIQDETDAELCQKIDIKKILVQFHLNAWKQITQKQLQPHIINAFLMRGVPGLCELLDYKGIDYEFEKYSDNIDFETGEVLQIPQIK